MVIGEQDRFLFCSFNRLSALTSENSLLTICFHPWISRTALTFEYPIFGSKRAEQRFLHAFFDENLPSILEPSDISLIMILKLFQMRISFYYRIISREHIWRGWTSRTYLGHSLDMFFEHFGHVLCTCYIIWIRTWMG